MLFKMPSIVLAVLALFQALPSHMLGTQRVTWRRFHETLQKLQIRQHS